MLGPDRFGIYALLLTINEILLFISGGGFIDYLTREAAKDPASGYASAIRLTQLRWLYLLGLVGLCLPVLWLLGYSQAVAVNSVLLSVALFPRAVNESCKGLLRAATAFQRFLWVELVEGATLVAVGALLLFRGAGIRGLIWAELAAAAMGALIALRLALPLFPRGLGITPAWSHVVRKSIAFNVYPLIVDVYDKVDIVLLSKLAGNAAVGLYTMPYRILPMLQVLPFGLMGVLLPTLSASHAHTEEKEASGQVLGLLYASALFFGLGALLLSDTVVPWALGPTYDGSATVLKIVIWAILPMFMNNVYNTILLAKNRERVFLVTSTVCMFVNIAANVILIPRYSYRAAAAVTIATEFVLLAQNAVIVKRTIGYLPLPRNFLRTTVSFAIISAVSLIALRWATPLVVGPLAALIFAVSVAANRTIQFSLHTSHARSEV